MSQAKVDAGASTDEEPLKVVFDRAMKLFENIESSNEPTSSEATQLSLKTAIAGFEKATNLVSLSGMFSSNEGLEELPTDTLQYLLLPALLGTLSLKLCGQPRKEVIKLAEIYFRDFLQRCKDYGVTDVELPSPADNQRLERVVTEQVKIANMVQSREAKIKRYNEMKELKEKLATLSKAMAAEHVDDENKREYFTTMLKSYISQALDELGSIEQEKPLLEYMEKHAGESKPKAPRAPPLRPFIITRDALQKAVLGAGYPSLPSMTVEEFYDKRVRDGIFPSAAAIPHQTLHGAEAEAEAGEADEAERARKEQLEEDDDPSARARARRLDDYKDEHRRGWGNRHNRS